MSLKSKTPQPLPKVADVVKIDEVSEQVFCSEKPHLPVQDPFRFITAFSRQKHNRSSLSLHLIG